MGNFKEDIAHVEAFVFDVDGVMTDGGIIPTADGDFIRRYNAKDGYALAYAVKRGYKICVITGGRGKLLERRLQMLGINRYYTDCMDKITTMRNYFAEEGIDPAHVIYMGDDIPDLECMREVGIPVCPADAASEVLETVRYVSEFCGGGGAVRDIIEQVLRARGDWARDTLDPRTLLLIPFDSGSLCVVLNKNIPNCGDCADEDLCRSLSCENKAILFCNKVL